MRKADLITAVAEQTKYNKIEVSAIIEATFEEIKEALKKGESTWIRGFASFTLVERKAKIVRNIKEGTSMPLAAHMIPSFKPAKELKNFIKNGIQATSTLPVVTGDSAYNNQEDGQPF